MSANQNHSKNTIKVALTGAAGQIAYSLIPLILNGSVFGADAQIDLRLIDIAPMEPKLRGVQMEIEDCNPANLASLLCTSDLARGLHLADIAILAGGFPRKAGMRRADLLLRNKPIFEAAGRALAGAANPEVKVLVVANPANSNALVLLRSSGLKARNVTALTRLDCNRAAAFLSRACGRPAQQVRDVFVWGNHSSTQVADCRMAKAGGEKARLEAGQEELVEFVAARGGEVIEARGLSSAMSAADAIKDHLRDWIGGERCSTSMAVLSDGNPFGIADGLFFSFPLELSGGDWRFHPGVEFPPEGSFLARRIKESERELVAERDQCFAAKD